jgi:hypothetical protein
LNKTSGNEIPYSEKMSSGKGETPFSEGKPGNRDDNSLTDRTMGFHPYVERESGSVIGHPLTDGLVSGWGEIPQTDGRSGNRGVVSLTDETSGFNPCVERLISRRGEIPLSEGESGVVVKTTTNETSDSYPCVESFPILYEKQNYLIQEKTLQLKKILGIIEEMNMINLETLWNEFEMEINCEDEINVSERRLISDHPDFDYNLQDISDLRVIFDSGCTSHICSDLRIFDTIYDEKGTVKLPDKTTIRYE